MLIAAAIVASTLSSVGLAEPSRWIRIDRTPNLVLYVDSFRVEKLPDDRVSIWTRWEFSKAQVLMDKEFDRMVVRVVLDCAGTRMMQTETNLYKGEGFLLHVDIPEDQRQWAEATPESINETLIVRGCLIARGQPTTPVP